MNRSTVDMEFIKRFAKVIASSPSLDNSSDSSPKSPRPGMAMRSDKVTRTSGLVASFFSRSFFSIRVFTNARHSRSFDSSIICQRDLGGGMSTSASSSFSNNAGFLPSRLFTTLDAASTSSITKITSLKPCLTGTYSPSILYVWSKKTDMSSELVEILARETLTMDRPVYWARALIMLVLPVPGGPWRSNPSLWGYPLIAYLPVLFWK
mmetsp:Transcript_21343/g.36354  ORF Transcript_21343/g.36354 Transcript_21343/m.36354 type:complete len:208 (+) Transcript_21343:681-1304(+)